MATQIITNNEVVLKNKDVSNIICIACLESKASKNLVLKSDLNSAMVIIKNTANELSIKLSGNMIYALAKVLYKKMEILITELIETKDMLTKQAAHKKIKKEEEGKYVRPSIAQKIKMNIAIPSPGEVLSIEEASQSSIEQMRHVASKEKITISDKVTPIKHRGIELTSEVLESHPGFLEELMRTEAGRHDLLDTSVLKSASKSLNLLLGSIQRDEERGLRAELGAEALSQLGIAPIDMSIESGRLSLPEERRIKYKLDEYLESYRKHHGEIIQEVEERIKKILPEEKPSKVIKPYPKIFKEKKWEYDEELEQAKVEAPIEAEIQYPMIMPEIKKEREETKPNLEPFENLLTDANINELQKNLGVSEISIELQEAERRRPELLEERALPTELDFEHFEYQPQELLPEEQYPGGFPSIMEREQLADRSIQDLHVLADRTNIPAIGIQIRDQEINKQKNHAKETLQKIEMTLQQATRKTKAVNFNEIIKDETKANKAKMFLDLMILCSQDKITLTQNVPFADIKIELTS